MFRYFSLALVVATTGCGTGNGDNVVSDAPTTQSDRVAIIAAGAETVVIGTKDGRKVYASHVPVPDARATIVLFHQAGSSAHEYDPVVPRLNAAGYSTLAVDQRTGGSLYGPNRTMARARKPSGSNYREALPDLEAALNWASLQGQPVILLGSSYSAGLIFPIAADNPRLVAALLAFSPAEYFDDKSYVRSAAAKVRVPVFVTSASTPDEFMQAKSIYTAVPGSMKVLYVPQKGGTHGASTLRPDRNAVGAEENWRVVLAFLKALDLESTTPRG